jgi:hypothetical protein
MGTYDDSISKNEEESITIGCTQKEIVSRLLRMIFVVVSKGRNKKYICVVYGTDETRTATKRNRQERYL